jgi:type IV pilus assembly protein PilY1
MKAHGKTFLLFNFALAALIGIAAGMPLNLQADDTEIYLGDDTLSAATRSNVLFILDTSGSMKGTDKTNPKVSRLKRMQDALINLLDNVNNVNVGLMRFTVPGGPVLYPVSYIDDSTAEADTGGVPEVDTRLSASPDDAEEVVCVYGLLGLCSTLDPTVGDVDTAGTELDLVLQPGTEGTPADISISQGSDDGESEQNGAWTVNDSDNLELTENGNGNRVSGFRFQNVNIPAGAYITSASLEFVSNSSRAGNTTLMVAGHNVGDSDTFPNSNSTVGSVTSPYHRWDNERTTAVVTFTDVTPWSDGDRETLTGLQKVVQEIIDNPGWAAGNNMSLLITGTPGSLREARSFDNAPAFAPMLHVRWTTGPRFRQLVGTRFQNINIPQGVTIKSAYIQVTPKDDADLKLDIDISAHAIGDAPAFDVQNISGRPLVSQNERWDLNGVGDDWTDNTPITTPDLKDVVQDIVDRSDWCGGNSMAFVFEYRNDEGSRGIWSYDGDPSKAPKLVIDWDQGSLADLKAGEGCVQQTISAQVSSSSDDAEQRTDKSTVSTGDKTMEMMDLSNSKVQTTGLRFQNLAIEEGATILSAELEFAAKKSDSGTTNLTIYGHSTTDAKKFKKGSGDDVKSRPKTSASVPWLNVPSWTQGKRYVTPDVSSIVQELVKTGSGWKSGNDMAFILTGSGLRQARTSDDSSGAVLRITLQGNIGDGTVAPNISVRQRLKEIVNELNADGGTPIVDTLYEAARYYRGEGVEYGKKRSKDKKDKLTTRVSHPGTYTGGSLYRESGCTDTNLDAKECGSERIDGSPIYTSPIEPQLCQSNFIVLLTDGEANNNNSKTLSENMLGVGKDKCIQKYSDGSKVSKDEECGVDVVKFLNENDQSSVEGTNTVATYTIGFNINNQFLNELASEGGGTFTEANSAADLIDTFNRILDDVQERTTSFATPALSVNAFNKLFHRNEVYFSLFQPGRDVRWEGNVKKYQLCSDTSTGCSLGEVLDAHTPPLPAIGADERIDDNALSFWSSSADGPAILEGGAGNETPTHTGRRLYTYTGATAPVSVVDLNVDEHKIVDANTDIDIPMLGGSTDIASPDYMSASDRTDLINWIRGQDVDDEDVDGDELDDRYSFTDPLHSSPIAVTYGGTAANPVIKLFVGTNDGGLQMINAATGVEEWTFIPQLLLDGQKRLRANPLSDHLYGVDGTPTIWLNDEDLNGIIDPSMDKNGDGLKEFVRIYVGLRRGGQSYYGLDATPTTAKGPLTNPSSSTDVTPSLIWRIDGGSGEYPQLGQSWSQPKLTTMRFGTNVLGQSYAKKVLVFAGGYNNSEDTSFNEGGPGNAIYVVDPETGSRLFWISSDDHLDSQGVLVPDMTQSIPSDLALMDSDGDGATDRIYVGDTGGKLWRVDIGADTTTTAGLKATVGKLAVISDPSEPADERKFFYPPDVVQVSNGAYSAAGGYDLVSIASGNRGKPLGTTVKDRFYAFRDYHTAPLVDGIAGDPSDDDGLADGYTTLQGPTVALAGDLMDLTDINGPTGSDLTTLESAYGYYIDLEGLGEKGLAAPIVLAGTVFFTSYTPEDVVQLSDCSLAEGGGKLYAFNVLNGEAVFNWDGVGDDSNLTKSDRTYTLGAGIPSSAVPIFQEEGITLLVGGGGGATTIDPDLALPRARTYWGQEE